jgi:sulfide:quinone oxidoreductase
VKARLRVVVAGGGVAALEAALALRTLAGSLVGVWLLSPEPKFWYRPLAVAEPFGLGTAQRYDLAQIAAELEAELVLGSLARVDGPEQVAYTQAGAALPYDALLIACGASPRAVVRGSTCFRGPADSERLGALLGELERGEHARVVFAVPWGATWSLPAYELALMTAKRLQGRDVSVAIASAEERPLELFGETASRAVAGLLEERGIVFHGGSPPTELHEGELRLFPTGAVPADVAVSLPRLYGQPLDGVPQTRDGFVPTDLYGRVQGLENVYAAGDVVRFPLKQGGIAAQQAVAAARTIAASAGAGVRPEPFRPVLRGLLLTGEEPRYLRRDVGATSSSVAVEPLWWPPAKVAGEHLAPFLRARDTEPEAEAAAPAGIEVEIDLGEVASAPEALPPGVGRPVRDVMRTSMLVVPPGATLAAVADRMREEDTGSALVSDGAGLLGILTSRDLLRAFAGDVEAGQARVREWMTADPVCLPDTATTGEAALLMVRHGVHHLPVVDRGEPIGIVDLRDVVAAGVPLPVGLGF